MDQLVSVLLLAVVVSCGDVHSLYSGQSHTPEADSDYYNEVHERWKEFHETARQAAETLLDQTLPTLLLELNSDVQLSPVCRSSLTQVASGVKTLKSWAIRMLDASGKPPSGLLGGTLTDLGDYDQCLAIVKKGPTDSKVEFQGQYCTVEAKPLLPSKPPRLTLQTHVLQFRNTTAQDSVLHDLSHAAAMFYFMAVRVGLCIPSTCSRGDLQEIFNSVVRQIPVIVDVRRCEVKHGVQLSAAQIGIICVLCILLALLLVGTAAEHVLRDGINTATYSNTRKKLVDSLKAFSVTANIEKVLRMSIVPDNLGVLDGIRCLSMMWIIVSHTYGFGHRQGLASLNNARRATDDISFVTLTNSWVSVDTFFFLGGLLVTQSNLKDMDKNGGKLHLSHFILHRFWRLMPPVAGMVGLMFLMPLIGSGPIWPDMAGRKVENCEKRWWQTLLPMNAWTHFDDMCLLHTWYVAVDIHFYCLTPIVLVSLYRSPTVGFLVVGVFTAVCAVATGAVTVVNGFYPTVLFFTPDIEITKKTADWAYFRPYPHMGAYCAGIVLGFILWQNKKITLRPVAQVLGWSAAITCNVSVLYAAYEWSRGNLPSLGVTVSYAMFHRTAWAIGIGWLIFMCCKGKAALLTRFLSWQLFVPLRRLSYSVYLLHFPVLWVRTSWRRHLVHFSHYDMVNEFFGILITTLTLSLVFHLLFEAPFLNLEQVWFPKKICRKESNIKISSQICNSSIHLNSPHKNPEIPPTGNSNSLTTENKCDVSIIKSTTGCEDKFIKKDSEKCLNSAPELSAVTQESDILPITIEQSKVCTINTVLCTSDCEKDLSSRNCALGNEYEVTRL